MVFFFAIESSLFFFGFIFITGEIVLSQIHSIGIVGRKNHIVAIEMFDHAVALKRHNPTRILMHAIINDE